MAVSIVPGYCVIPLDRHGGNMLEYRGCFDLTVLLETPGKPNAVVEIFFFFPPDNPIPYEVTQQR